MTEYSTIGNEIDRISENISDSYDVASSLGATLPQNRNSNNLAATLATISAGGGNNSYTEVLDSSLTPVEGICTWVVEHNLNTEYIICSLYQNDEEIQKDVSIDSANQITITFMASTTVAAESCVVVVLASGGSSGGSITVDSQLSSNSENPVQNKVINTALSGKQDTSNLVTSLSASSTDTQYPSAKCVYDLIGSIEAALSNI